MGLPGGARAAYERRGELEAFKGTVSSDEVQRIINTNDKAAALGRLSSLRVLPYEYSPSNDDMRMYYSGTFIFREAQGCHPVHV